MPDAPAESLPPVPNRKRRRLRLLGFIAAAVTVVIVCTLTAGYLTTRIALGHVQRIPNVFRGLNPASQPVMPAASRNSMTILVAGSDILSTVPTTGEGHHEPLFEPGQQRSDILMLVHINAGGHQASIISIPRDSWVPVPGHGMMKINAAFSLGGPALMIATVEKLTDVRIDHYMVVDFSGFSSMVSALGGVAVDVAQQTTTGAFTFRRGINYLTPAAALVYVRQRDGLPGGDLSRIQRQQNLIRAILLKTATSHVLFDPVTMYRLLHAFTNWVSVDSTFTNSGLLSLLLELRTLRGSNVSWLTAPVSGFGQEDSQDVVFLDHAGCQSLWAAIRNSTVAAWAKAHPLAQTPADPDLPCRRSSR